MAISPFKFLQEVRSETAKVTWPTRRETMITTIMVFVMVALASIFFFAADQLIRILVVGPTARLELERDDSGQIVEAELPAARARSRLHPVGR